MKKLLLALLLTGALIFIGKFVFSADHFTEVPVQLEVSAYEYANEEFVEAYIIENQDEIRSFNQALNKARHENRAYEIARTEDYRIKMVYGEGTTDTLRLWLDFGEDFDMFQTNKTIGHYKLKNNEAREAVREILEQSKQN